MTVRDLLTSYLMDLEDEGKRVDSISGQVKPVLRKMGERDVEELKPRDFEVYRRERRLEQSRYGGPVSHSTINRELTYVRAALRRAEFDELIDNAPRIRMRKETHNRTIICTPMQIVKILSYLEKHPVVHDVIVLLWHTGWRLREVLHLTWDEVDMLERTITLPPERTKTDQPRVFPFERGSEIEQALVRRAMEAVGGQVFHHGEGRRIYTIKRAWRSAINHAGIPDLQVRDLRNSYATRNTHRLPIPILMKVQGWKDHRMPMRYARLNSDDVRRALKDMQQG